jgi:hypothetical protein
MLEFGSGFAQGELLEVIPSKRILLVDSCASKKQVAHFI